MASPRRAVVFAYHNVGVRCLKVLLAGGVDVALVVTHHDSPGETIWFDSVLALCASEGLACITPPDAGSPALLSQAAAARPDFIFSFYYRHLLPPALLALAPAYNMHGALLPRFRGRAPVNWAVLHGATETGATLHEMTARPDAGAIVAQSAVPILPDDTAFEVAAKVTVAAEQALWCVLPALLEGTAPRLPNELHKGSYFGRRTPDDGRIDWSQDAQQVYNLYRATAPPWPGAFTDVGGRRYIIGSARLHPDPMPMLAPGLAVVGDAILGVCGDGRALAIARLLLADGQAVPPTLLERQLSELAT
jgi:methionyl-tRNA formyltransferase